MTQLSSTGKGREQYNKERGIETILISVDGEFNKYIFANSNVYQ